MVAASLPGRRPRLQPSPHCRDRGWREPSIRLLSEIAFVRGGAAAGESSRRLIASQPRVSRYPPLAMAAYIRAICNGVAVSAPWPIANDLRLARDAQFAAVGSGRPLRRRDRCRWAGQIRSGRPNPPAAAAQLSRRGGRNRRCSFVPAASASVTSPWPMPCWRKIWQRNRSGSFQISLAVERRPRIDGAASDQRQGRQRLEHAARRDGHLGRAIEHRLAGIVQVLRRRSASPPANRFGSNRGALAAPAARRSERPSRRSRRRAARSTWGWRSS